MASRFVFSEERKDRLIAATEAVEAAQRRSDLVGREETPWAASVETHWIQIEDLTPVEINGRDHYDATRYSYDATDGTYNAENAVWVFAANGEIPELEQLYLARIHGDADPDPGGGGSDPRPSLSIGAGAGGETILAADYYTTSLPAYTRTDNTYDGGTVILSLDGNDLLVGDTFLFNHLAETGGDPDNGVLRLTNQSDGATSQWQAVRVDEMSTGPQLQTGLYVKVLKGNTFHSTLWSLKTVFVAEPEINADALEFRKINVTPTVPQYLIMAGDNSAAELQLFTGEINVINDVGLPPPGGGFDPDLPITLTGIVTSPPSFNGETFRLSNLTTSPIEFVLDPTPPDVDLLQSDLYPDPDTVMADPVNFYGTCSPIVMPGESCLIVARFTDAGDDTGQWYWHFFGCCEPEIDLAALLAEQFGTDEGSLLGVVSGVWQEVTIEPADCWATARKDSDQTGVDDTPADVTDLGVAVANGQTLRFRAYLRIVTNDAGTGGMAAVNGPTADFVTYVVREWGSFEVSSAHNSYDDFTTMADGLGAVTIYEIFGVAKFGDDGTFVPRVKAETGGTLDVLAGSWMEYDLQ